MLGGASTVVTMVAVLLAESGSGAGELTVSVLVMSPPAVGVTTTVKFRAPSARLGQLGSPDGTGAGRHAVRRNLYWLASVTPAGLFLVVFCLAVNWFGDSLDGTLARVRGHQRPRYGFYVDHVVDAVGAVFLFGGMGLSGYMSPFGNLLALLVAYLLLMVETSADEHAPRACSR